MQTFLTIIFIAHTIAGQPVSPSLPPSLFSLRPLTRYVCSSVWSNSVSCSLQIAAQAVLFMCMNTAGIFISYLSDRAQRQAFLETRRCVEARLRLETENQRQVLEKQSYFCMNCRCPWTRLGTTFKNNEYVVSPVVKMLWNRLSEEQEPAVDFIFISISHHAKSLSFKWMTTCWIQTRIEMVSLWRTELIMYFWFLICFLWQFSFTWNFWTFWTLKYYHWIMKSLSDDLVTPLLSPYTCMPSYTYLKTIIVCEFNIWLTQFPVSEAGNGDWKQLGGEHHRSS